MPKRSNDEDSDEYIRRKMRKIEKRLRKRKNKRQRRLSSDSDISDPGRTTPVLSLPEDGQDPNVMDSVVIVGDGLPSSDGCLDPIPATSAQSAPEECILDSDILELLGESPSESNKTGDNIQKDLVLRWEHIATSGLTKEVRKGLLDKHLVPGNCLKVAAPLLNAEIKAALSDTLTGKDKVAQYKQSQVTSIIACIGEALTKILNSDNRDTLVIKPLLEGAQLLCDLQHGESMKRRSLICASIKNEIKNQLYETKIDTYLFGENLADCLKTAKAINKSGSEIKVSRPKVAATRTQSLNFKPRPGTSRQPARRIQEPAAYQQSVFPTASSTQTPRRQYAGYPPPPPLALPPPPPPPPLPPQPAAQQQRAKQRPYQRR